MTTSAELHAELRRRGFEVRPQKDGGVYVRPIARVDAEVRRLVRDYRRALDRERTELIRASFDDDDSEDEEADAPRPPTRATREPSPEQAMLSHGLRPYYPTDETVYLNAEKPRAPLPVPFAGDVDSVGPFGCD